MTFNKLTRLTRNITFIMSAAASFLLLLSLIFSFDPISGYFNGGALPTLFIIIYVSGAVASVVVPLVIRTNEKTVVADVPSKSITNAQAILSILCIFAGLVIILLNPSISSDAYLFIALGGVCFGLYFLIADSKPHGESRFLKLGLLAPTLALPYGIFFGNNSNFARHINSVENALCAIFCIFICAYIYNKGRNISDPKVTKWQLGFNLASVFSGIAFSIPYILAFVFGSVNEISRLLHAIIILFISLLCAADLFTLENAHEPIEVLEIEGSENPEAEEIEEAAEADEAAN